MRFRYGYAVGVLMAGADCFKPSRLSGNCLQAETASWQAQATSHGGRRSARKQVSSEATVVNAEGEDSGTNSPI